MTRHPKRRNPNGASGNKPSPRRGEKTKQSKVTPVKETEAKVAVQTKLSFGQTVTQPTTPTMTATLSTTITPEATTVAKRLVHPSPCTTPERPKATNTTKTTTPQNPTETNEESDDAKPPAKPTTQKKPPPTTTTLTDTQKTTKNKQKTVTIPNDKTTKSTKSTAKKPPVPPALQTPASTYRAIRYNGMIETPPSDKPYKDFVIILKAYLQIIQDTLGKDIYLATWDAEQEKAFPVIKSPSKIPSSRESLGIYLGTYVNPKKDGSRVYLNLRLVTYKPHQVPLERFGAELADNFSNSEHQLTIYRQPRSCQAARSDCIGWLMYSCKSMNSSTFVPALKLALNIPDTVKVGIQYRSILLDNGKKPTYDKENPPAAALHIDMDERYSLVFQARAASLWRKNSKQRLPNGVQLRLVPCFSSAIGKAMTEAQCSDATTLKERQYYFIKEHLKILPANFFISQLDTPLSDANSMTLRRAIMSRAPSKHPQNRLVHNIDAAWNQPSKHTITTVVGREAEAQRFLVNMVPEFLHRFGSDATKWFTGEALLIYEDLKWHHEKEITTSRNERESEAMVQKD